MLDWKQCEGELAGGEFPLEQYLAGSEARAVFVTRCASGRAAIKLVLAGDGQGGVELAKRWNRAATLSHPHLIRIFAAGTWVLAGEQMAYLVMEYAEENLGDVLRERPLTTDETREMLEPVADALAYLHGQGLTHGNLKPSNILAVENTVKISAEAVSAGDPAADIWALGVTAVQALTQPAPTLAQGRRDSAVDALPFPFREMVQNCLRDDPRLRWSAGKIGDWLRSPGPPSPALPTPAAPVAKSVAAKPRLPYYVGALILIVVGASIFAVLVTRPTSTPVPVATKPMQPEAAAAAGGTAPIRREGSPQATPSVPPHREAKPPVARRVPRAPEDGVMRRVLPDIPAKARSTVHGKAAVVVRVAVDPAGHVTEGTLQPGGSPYFGKLALEAARQWQFAPVEGGGRRIWILRFEIMRTATQVIPLRAGAE